MKVILKKWSTVNWAPLEKWASCSWVWNTCTTYGVDCTIYCSTNVSVPPRFVNSDSGIASFCNGLTKKTACQKFFLCEARLTVPGLFIMAACLSRHWQWSFLELLCILRKNSEGQWLWLSLPADASWPLQPSEDNGKRFAVAACATLDLWNITTLLEAGTASRLTTWECPSLRNSGNPCQILIPSYHENRFFCCHDWEPSSQPLNKVRQGCCIRICIILDLQ